MQRSSDAESGGARIGFDVPHGASLLLLLVLLAAVPLLHGGRPRSHSCTTTADGKAVSNALGSATWCRNRVVSEGGSVACEPTPAPACSSSFVPDALALTYGPALEDPVAYDPVVLGDQFHCQSELGLAAWRYASRRLQRRIEGASPEQADALASAELDAIGSACDVTVGLDEGGVVLPRVGPQCSAALGPPGAVVDAAALQGCVHALLATWVERIGPDPRPLRPNILFILTDDQRWDTIGPIHAPPGRLGMPLVTQELLGSGVEFREAFVNTPLCCPSRASLLNGLYSSQHGVFSTDPDVPHGGAPAFDDSSTIATWLQAAGYRTGLFGKYLNAYSRLCADGPYVPPGWDEWRAFKNPNYFNYTMIENGVQVAYGSAEQDYSTDMLRDRLLDFIDDAVTRQQPFFAYFAPISPHSPEVPAPRHAGSFAGLAPFRPPSFNEPDVSDKPPYISARAPYDEVEIDAFRIAQMEMLQAVDEAVAAVMERLRQHGIEDQTFVVFTSDNGYYWGEHRVVAKDKPYDEDIRVPLIVRYPPLAPLPRQEDRLALNVDLPMTFADLAGVHPGPRDGQSLLGVLDGSAASWRTDFLAEGWPAGKEWGSVRESRWKYNEYLYTKGVYAELYDLETDPYELENLLFDPAHADRIAAMAGRLRALRPHWPDDATWARPPAP